MSGKELKKRVFSSIGICIRSHTRRMERHMKFVYNKSEGHTKYCGYIMLDEIAPYEVAFVNHDFEKEGEDAK